MADRRTINAEAERRHLAQLVLRVGEGESAALAELYQRTSAKLFGICLRICADRSEAEDALQDVYINVWRHAGRFDPARASPITWLAVLARNRAIDRLRAGRSKLTAPIEEAADVADEAESALAGLEAAEQAGRLRACLEELERAQSAAIASAFFEGFTYGELATRMKVPLGTMKSWVRRGLIRLRECLER